MTDRLLALYSLRVDFNCFSEIPEAPIAIGLPQVPEPLIGIQLNRNRKVVGRLLDIFLFQ